MNQFIYKYIVLGKPVGVTLKKQFVYGSFVYNSTH